MRLSAEGSEYTCSNNERYDKLYGRYPQIAQACIQAEGSAFLGFGEKETDIGHAGREVAAAEAAQERQYHHGNVAGVRVLNGKTQADSRQQQAGGRDGRPFAAAEYGHHERIEDTQGRPG